MYGKDVHVRIIIPCVSPCLVSIYVPNDPSNIMVKISIVTAAGGVSIVNYAGRIVKFLRQLFLQQAMPQRILWWSVNGQVPVLRVSGY